MTIETNWIFGKAAYLMTQRLLLASTSMSIFSEELDERVRNCSICGIELADWVILRICFDP